MIFGRSFNQDSQNSSHKPSPDQTPADFKRLKTRYQLSETLWRRTRVNVAIRVCSSLSQKQQEQPPSLHREVVLWVGNQKAICCLQVWDRLGKDGTSPSVKSTPPPPTLPCAPWSQTLGRPRGGLLVEKQVLELAQGTERKPTLRYCCLVKLEAFPIWEKCLERERQPGDVPPRCSQSALPVSWAHLLTRSQPEPKLLHRAAGPRVKPIYYQKLLLRKTRPALSFPGL